MRLTPKELFQIVADGQSMWQQVCELRDRNRAFNTENLRLHGVVLALKATLDRGTLPADEAVDLRRG